MKFTIIVLMQYMDNMCFPTIVYFDSKYVSLYDKW